MHGQQIYKQMLKGMDRGPASNFANTASVTAGGLRGPGQQKTDWVHLLLPSSMSSCPYQGQNTEPGTLLVSPSRAFLMCLCSLSRTSGRLTVLTAHSD